MDLIIAPYTVAQAQADIVPISGTPALATNGNPATGVPATVAPAYHYNLITLSLVGIVDASGLPRSGSDPTTLLRALKTLFVPYGGLGLGGWQEQYYTLTGNTTKAISATFTAPCPGVVHVVASANLATQSSANIALSCSVNGTQLSGDNVNNSTGLTNHGVLVVPKGQVTVSSTFGSAASGTSPNVGHSLSYIFVPS